MRPEEIIVDTLDNPFAALPDLPLTKDDVDIFCQTRVWKEITSMYNKKIVSYRVTLHNLELPREVKDALLAKLAMSEQFLALPRWLREKDYEPDSRAEATEETIDKIMEEMSHAT
jgi:hypothetical protein